ncbi:CesT family type III secretion system chaperone [Herbaspirillum sp. RV1423]|uniref:CesT family type III secretion system chaperone n=1 Tax=Herbaspirillum sp. RV1423 TaxID=1443993 RepID=UPI00054FC67B|nr:CesT family type III secretion system chaperone [Herbaspirillum sp. RV1423]
MSIERYRVLIDRLCASLNIPAPGTAYQVAHITLYGREFTLCYGGVLAPESLLLYCDFGAMPAGRRDLVPLRLLEINTYLFDERCAAFTYDAASHQVVLVCRLELDDAALRSTLDYFSALAQCWHQDYFLAADEASASKPRSD